VTLSAIREAIEFLAGERDDAPWFLTSTGTGILIRCLCWIVGILLIYAFSGQSSKFIYIDF